MSSITFGDTAVLFDGVATALGGGGGEAGETTATMTTTLTEAVTTAATATKTEETNAAAAAAATSDTTSTTSTPTTPTTSTATKTKGPCEKPRMAQTVGQCGEDDDSGSSRRRIFSRWRRSS